MFLWILNFLFHWKLKEVTTEALKGAESTRTSLRRWEESSDLKVYVLQTGKVSFQSNLESYFYFSYCDSLKNCASQFSENCVQTVNDNNSEAQSKFQKVWNIYAFNKDNTLQLLSLEKGSWGRWQKIPYFWVVIEVRGNSKTKGLERGRKRRARLRCSHASRVWHSHAAAALIFRAFKKTILRKKKPLFCFLWLRWIKWMTL